MGFREERTIDDAHDAQEAVQRLLNSILGSALDSEDAVGEQAPHVDETVWNLAEMSTHDKLCIVLDETLNSLLREEVSLDNAKELQVLVNVAIQLGKI